LVFLLKVFEELKKIGDGKLWRSPGSLQEEKLHMIAV